ncbi:MAG: hypothetical protein CSA09_01360 [Candidatus Contendobacter odensis]|uniref:ABC transporter permease n=1 Tax=Candidatus Contendibacter odensensis TaxID=1400860 RepID=A0A2G6PG54_9GAMM|nr:MAG: hypothetical protein CSA09_01360 [Candidatus Contendobacter odensis]
MNDAIQTISLVSLSIAFIPVLIVITILFKWSLDVRKALYAVVRMLVQLLLIGYFLTYIFKSDSATIILVVLTIMVLASSWIALGVIEAKRLLLYRYALVSITLGGGVTLILVTQFVLNLDPWYAPQFMVPLAGMIFVNSMNGISLAVERLNAEMEGGMAYKQSRHVAFRASLIPIINSLFAVGLVSLPGMMTGQILSGVSPLIAVRYQIMAMCMIFGSTGISAACFLIVVRPVFEKYEAIRPQ